MIIEIGSIAHTLLGDRGMIVDASYSSDDDGYPVNELSKVNLLLRREDKTEFWETVSNIEDVCDPHEPWDICFNCGFDDYCDLWRSWKEI